MATTIFKNQINTLKKVKPKTGVENFIRMWKVL